VAELDVYPDAWVAERTLQELDLRSEGALALGIQRADDGAYVGVRRGPSRIGTGDVLIVYGRAAAPRARPRRARLPLGPCVRRYFTTTTPFMNGCGRQWNVYVPGFVNVCE